MKNLRERNGWTLQEVANKAGISHASLSRMENAKQDPENPETLKKLAEVYNVPHTEMLKAAGFLDADKEKEIELSPELVEFVKTFNQLSQNEKDQLLNFGKYLHDQIKRGE